MIPHLRCGQVCAVAMDMTLLLGSLQMYATALESQRKLSQKLTDANAVSVHICGSGWSSLVV
jgi:hypothetical protein